jgi:hypothetical protein
MTEKQEAAKESESLSDRILHRLISIVPYLLLSSVIAFLLFKYLYEKFGSNSLGAVILGIIITAGIAFLIPITVGRIYNDRWVGSSLAFLIPVVVFMEAAIQFGQPVADMIPITFMGIMFVGIFSFVVVYDMLSISPLVNIEEIKEDKVVCIKIFSGLEDVEKLIDDVLSYLTFSHREMPTSDNKVRQWVLRPNHCYLSARSHDDNSTDLAFLFFTEGGDKLYQSKQNVKDLNFVKKTIEGHLRLDNRECQSIPNSPLQSDLLERALERYKRERAPIGKELSNIGRTLRTNLKVIIGLLIIAFMIYIGRDILTQVYEEYPWIFMIIAGPLMYPLIDYLLKFLKESGKK